MNLSLDSRIGLYSLALGVWISPLFWLVGIGVLLARLVPHD